MTKPEQPQRGGSYRRGKDGKLIPAEAPAEKEAAPVTDAPSKRTGT
jgi:hypothetical protein